MRTSTVDALVAAELRELVVLQHVQQLSLQAGLHLADLVEHQRAAVGVFELADARRRGAGERAFFVAEQLAFEQVVGQRRAIHFDERLGAPHRPIVDRARDQFLADAALATHAAP